MVHRWWLQQDTSDQARKRETDWNERPDIMANHENKKEIMVSVLVITSEESKRLERFPLWRQTSTCRDTKAGRSVLLFSPPGKQSGLWLWESGQHISTWWSTCRWHRTWHCHLSNTWTLRWPSMNRELCKVVLCSDSTCFKLYFYHLNK